jgi:hypothetical protein
MIASVMISEADVAKTQSVRERRFLHRRDKDEGLPEETPRLDNDEEKCREKIPA